MAICTKMHDCFLKFAQANLPASRHCQTPIILISLTISLIESRGMPLSSCRHILLLKENPFRFSLFCFNRFSQTEFSVSCNAYYKTPTSKGVCPVSTAFAVSTAPFAFFYNWKAVYQPVTHTHKKNAQISDLADLHKKCANLDKLVTPFCSGNRESLSVKHKRITILYSPKEKTKQDHSVIPSEQKNGF